MLSAGVFGQDPPVTNDPLCQEDGIYFLPHESDCTKFYECVFGDKYTLECPAGLHFNPEAQVCDFPELAGCEPGSTGTPMDTTTPQLTETPWTELTTTDEPVITTPQSSCPPDGVHYLPYPGDCAKFIICNEGEMIVQECPAGLHFNPEIGNCDFPENAGCEEREYLYR